MEIQHRELRAPVEGLEFSECPTSLVARNPEMVIMVNEILDMRWLKESCGAAMFGQDASEWDARLFHAVKLAEIEDRRVEAARDSVRGD